MNKSCTKSFMLAGFLLTAVFLPTLAYTQSTPASLGKGEVSLLEPRRIAATIVAAALPSPKRIVNVGARQGEFLEVFLDQFPNADGQWTEPKESIDNHNIDVAKLRLARFGNRVTYVIGGYGRDISDGSVPRDADVIVTDWMSINQNLDGMYKIFRIAADQLPHGGWLVNLDHVGFGGSNWESRLRSGSKGFRPDQEGPKTKFAEIRVPTVDEQLGALRAAGLDARVGWQSFNLALFMARKP
jgi:hypothetical protein